MILDANLQINLKTAKESYYFFLQTFTERCFLTKTAVAALPVWENSHRYNIINKVWYYKTGFSLKKLMKLSKS
jgi:hypothetical protein